jgi:hypothetical protein
LHSNPKGFISSYGNVKTDEAAAARSGDSEEEEEDNNKEEEDDIKDDVSMAKTPADVDDEELNAATLAPESDAPTRENNSASKSLFLTDAADTSSPTSTIRIVDKVMTVDEGWHDKTVIKSQTKTEWRHYLL